ncbi:hypothetical protein LCGC14_2234850, partial [marine sediment metagenome]
MGDAVGSVIPLKRAHALERAGRRELLDIYQHYHQMGNEWLRREIIDHNRIDILATAVLGYEVQPFHLRMLQYQFQHPNSLQLAFRGAGKTTLCTVTKAIHYLLKDPDLRILIASDIMGDSTAILREIKGHYENGVKLAEVFGPYFDPARVTKWGIEEIDVLPRTKFTKEASISCVGADTAVASRHVDVILADDLVVEKNSRTSGRRGKLHTWVYQSLDPCLEPPDPHVPHRGEHHRLGTRYHWDDHYGHLIEHELAEHHQIIPALDEKGRSPWPEKYPPEWFEKKKKIMGTILFNSQHLCDTEAMKGEIEQKVGKASLKDFEKITGVSRMTDAMLRAEIAMGLDVHQVQRGIGYAPRRITAAMEKDIKSRRLRPFKRYDAAQGSVAAGAQRGRIQPWADKLRSEVVAEQKAAGFVEDVFDPDYLKGVEGRSRQHA